MGVSTKDMRSAASIVHLIICFVRDDKLPVDVQILLLSFYLDTGGTLT